MRKLRKYDKEFKLDAISAVTENGESLREVADRLEMPVATLNAWVVESKRKANQTADPFQRREINIERYAEDQEEEEQVHTPKVSNKLMMQELAEIIETLSEERDLLKSALNFYLTARK